MLAHFIYNLGIYGYSGVIALASLWNEKARLWMGGRKNWKENLKQWRAQHPGKLFWFHCASLGEFEQGRSVMEAIRNQHPEIKIVLTFFSPSGYEIRKNYHGADGVFYLPADTPSNAKSFVEILQPKAVFFVKYEYWANYFFACKRARTPLFIISAILRPDQRFFGVMKSFWQQVLQSVHHFFVQNDETLRLLQEHGFDQATKCGDTRFDRVMSIAAHKKDLPEIEAFAQDHFVLVAGSSWPQDEELIANSAEIHDIKIICVPHEIDESHIQSIEAKFPGSIRWSQLRGKSLQEARVMIVDTIGMLSSVYPYADVVVIGGGFGKGIHNTLEAAVWGKPIVFGPVYHKFGEAIDLIKNNAAHSVQNQSGFDAFLHEMKDQSEVRSRMGHQAKTFVESSAGATSRIMNFLSHQNIL